MKITKRQLRRIIKEERQKLLIERGSGNPALRDDEQKLRIATVNFVDKYMMAMGMNPGNPADLQKTRRIVDDIIGAVMDVL